MTAVKLYQDSKRRNVMNSKVEYLTQIFISNGLIMENEITENNYRQIFNSIADDIDSLLYISILSEIEEYYCIQLPDEVLMENIFHNIDDFVILLDDEINKKTKEV